MQSIEALRPRKFKVSRSRNRHTDELLSTYLNDVGRYPLLTRDAERTAAFRLEKCRRVYRRQMLASDRMLALCCETFKKVERREQRLESIFSLSPRDRKKAKQIRGQLAAVISTTERFLDSNAGVPDILMRRKEVVHVIERLGLRTRIIREMWKRASSDNIAAKNRNRHQQRTRRLQQIERTWIAAQKRFARHNLRLVVSIAKQYKSSQLPLLDLVQEGSLGLLMAVENFEPGLGFKFSTYASWWIREMIQRGIRSHSQTIRLTETARTFLHRVNRQIAQLERQSGGRLNQELIDSELRLTRIERQSLRAIQQAPRSIHSRDHEDDCEISEVIPDTRTRSPSDTAHHHHLREELTAALSKCKPRDRNIILWRFGLDGHWPQTLEAIAKRISLSRERVRQIERELLKQLADDLAAFRDVKTSTSG